MLRFLTLVAALVLLIPSDRCAAQALRPDRRPSPRLVAPAVVASPVTASSTPVAAASASDETLVDTESLERWISWLVVEQMPHEYENKKKWGGTKKVMSGLDVEVDGVKIETRRQWKEANHGTWQAYKLKLLDPANDVLIDLENMRDLGDNRAAFDLIVQAKIDCFGRMAEWRRGVQLVSLQAEGEARVRLKASVEVKMGLDPSRLPPDILIDPKVTAAELKMEEFKLRRVSKAEGPLVSQLGSVVERGVDEYLEENRQKIVDKMNAAIAKKRDKLRIPVSKVAESKWGDWFGAILNGKKS